MTLYQEANQLTAILTVYSWIYSYKALRKVEFLIK